LESDDAGNPHGPELSDVVAGEPVEEPDSPEWDRWAMEYHALPKDGVELTLELRSEAHVVLRVVDHSDGLPDAPGIDEARPPDTMPEDDLPTTTRFADATFVGKSFDLTGRTEVRLPAWGPADDQRYGPLRVASVREAVDRRR